jgi:hypothetical protein
MVSTFCIYGKVSKPTNTVYVQYPWLWQEPLEVTSDLFKELILKDEYKDTNLCIHRLFPKIPGDWGIVFDIHASRRYQPKMIRIKSGDYNYEVLGNFIIAGIDEADRLRGLFQHEVDLILSFRPTMWEILVKSASYPAPE